jgi:hypothetical protein
VTALPPTGSLPAALTALAEPTLPVLLAAAVCLVGSVLVYRIRGVP